MGFLICLWPMMTGAALTLFLVNAAAAMAGLSETSSATSGPFFFKSSGCGGGEESLADAGPPDLRTENPRGSSSQGSFGQSCVFCLGRDDVEVLDRLSCSSLQRLSIAVLMTSVLLETWSPMSQ